MKKLWWLLPVLVVALGWWAYHRKNDPPKVPFARVIRETLVSTLATNGKVEPIDWQAVRVERAGVISKVPVQEGQTIGQGGVLATLSETGLQADLNDAEARVAQARADLGTIEAGGRQSELTTIDNELARVRSEKDVAQRDYASLHRLAEKQAATAVEVQMARSKLNAAELAIDSLAKRRAALIGKSDKAVALARLQDAEAAVELAKVHIAQTIIRAPIGGVVYNLTARAGAYLNVGELVANVGQTGRLRVRVYVDEPELGRVQAGQPVTITWDALPGHKWEGTVERKPANIVPLGSRQVGEVPCTIDNPNRELVPGTNVDAHIRTATVTDALTVAKECLRRDANGVGVFVLHSDHIAWRGVTTGVSSVARVQILRGLAEGDAVALPTDLTLHNGEAVEAAYP